MPSYRPAEDIQYSNRPLKYATDREWMEAKRKHDRERYAVKKVEWEASHPGLKYSSKRKPTVRFEYRPDLSSMRVVVPEEVLQERHRAFNTPQSLTAAAMGDPLPGRSALDKERMLCLSPSPPKYPQPMPQSETLSPTGPTISFAWPVTSVMHSTER